MNDGAAALVSAVMSLRSFARSFTSARVAGNLAGLSLVALFAACSSSSSRPSSSVSPPDSAAGGALGFVLGAMNGATVSAADLAAHISPSVLATTTTSALIAEFTQLAQSRPWTLVGFEGTPAAAALTAIVTRGDGQYWRVTIAMDATIPTSIDHLLPSEAGDLDPALQSWSAVDAQLARVAPELSQLAADLDGGGCASELHALAGDDTHGLGSQFKLYVLATLADSVAQGTHGWGDMLAIQDQYKSLPTGTFQDEPVGTQFTLEQFADNMISLSDNTAADHLIALLGRDAIEAMFTTAKHHDPTLDQPLPTTREFFDLKLMVDEPARQAYAAASAADKLALLTQYDATLDPRNATNAAAWTAPIDIDKIEWFGSTRDTCNAMATLKSYADTTANQAVYNVLSINPGIADDAHLFSYLGYKGGSEPGVLTLSFLVRRASDGGWRYYGAQLNDTMNAIDQDRAVYV
ncbi:MAG TPA: serine hydrolase, partial [Polyangia bacterium]|nr:serine hydrolase [Polyangia bacterium]